MAVGLGPLPTLHPVPGFELGIASAGIKRPGRKDVVVMRCAEGSTVAGVFTRNAFCAAPVILCKQRFLGPVRYLVTNTGNANAGTGTQGLANAERVCARLAALAGCPDTLEPARRQAWCAAARTLLEAELHERRLQARVQELEQSRRLQQALYEIADLAGGEVEM